MLLSSTTVNDGRRVTLGDWVEFKCDIEQSGCITKIVRNPNGYTELHLRNDNGFDGEYIGGETETIESAGDCW